MEPGGDGGGVLRGPVEARGKRSAPARWDWNAAPLFRGLSSYDASMEDFGLVRQITPICADAGSFRGRALRQTVQAAGVPTGSSRRFVALGILRARM